jgi:hypothetical protein
MMQVAIGAVIHNDMLTVAIRRGDQLDEPIQHALGTPLEAVALLLDQRVRHRHDDPIIYLEANSTAGAVLDGIRSRDARSRDQIVNGLSAAISVAGAGVMFYDRRSELHYRFRERVSQGKFLVPAAYEQISAFAEQVKDARIFFPYVDDVAQKLGRFPALAVAAVLAAMDVPFRRDATPRDHDPYNPSARGHDPYAH